MKNLKTKNNVQLRENSEEYKICKTNFDVGAQSYLSQKTNRGITLIALVITIIVLLILSAVTLNLVLGENGIITKANRAKTLTDEASIQEELELAIASYMADNEGKFDLDGFVASRYFPEGFTKSGDNTVVKNGVELSIDTNGTVKIIGNNSKPSNLSKEEQYLIDNAKTVLLGQAKASGISESELAKMNFTKYNIENIDDIILAYFKEINTYNMKEEDLSGEELELYKKIQGISNLEELLKMLSGSETEEDINAAKENFYFQFASGDGTGKRFNAIQSISKYIILQIFRNRF